MGSCERLGRGRIGRSSRESRSGNDWGEKIIFFSCNVVPLGYKVVRGELSVKSRKKRQKNNIFFLKWVLQ
jgi:hypothetical protein